MRRNLAFEWVRASTLRSTWGFPLLGILMVTAITVVMLLFGGSPDADLPDPTMGELLVNAGNPLGVVFMTTICAQAFGHEYRDGTMRLVLSEFPARSRVFLSKLLIPALIVAGAVLVASAIIAILAATVGGGVEMGSSAAGLLTVIARQVAIAVWWGLMVAGITALLRNLAAGIVFALVLSAILEGLLFVLLGSRLGWLDDVLPFTAATQWASDGGTRHGLVALGWVAVVVGAAWVRFLKRDA